MVPLVPAKDTETAPVEEDDKDGLPTIAVERDEYMPRMESMMVGSAVDDSDAVPLDSDGLGNPRSEADTLPVGERGERGKVSTVVRGAWSSRLGEMRVERREGEPEFGEVGERVGE